MRSVGYENVRPGAIVVSNRYLTAASYAFPLSIMAVWGANAATVRFLGTHSTLQISEYEAQMVWDSQYYFANGRKNYVWFGGLNRDNEGYFYRGWQVQRKDNDNYDYYVFVYRYAYPQGWELYTVYSTLDVPPSQFAYFYQWEGLQLFYASLANGGVAIRFGVNGSITEFPDGTIDNPIVDSNFFLIRSRTQHNTLYRVAGTAPNLNLPDVIQMSGFGERGDVTLPVSSYEPVWSPVTGLYWIIRFDAGVGLVLTGSDQGIWLGNESPSYTLRYGATAWCGTGSVYVYGAQYKYWPIQFLNGTMIWQNNSLVQKNDFAGWNTSFAERNATTLIQGIGRYLGAEYSTKLISPVKPYYSKPDNVQHWFGMWSTPSSELFRPYYHVLHFFSITPPAIQIDESTGLYTADSWGIQAFDTNRAPIDAGFYLTKKLLYEGYEDKIGWRYAPTGYYLPYWDFDKPLPLGWDLTYKFPRMIIDVRGLPICKENMYEFGRILHAARRLCFLYKGSLGWFKTNRYPSSEDSEWLEREVFTGYGTINVTPYAIGEDSFPDNVDNLPIQESQLVQMHRCANMLARVDFRNKVTF